MANVNINAGAPGNPLDALLGGSPLQGTVGRSISDTLAAAMSGDASARDWLVSNGYGHMVQTGESPYFEMGKDGFTPTGYITRNGREYSQLRSTNIGGPGEARDPSQVINDPTYGLLAPLDSIKAPSDLGAWIGPAFMAALTGGVGMYAAGAGLAGAEGANAAGDLASTGGIASTDAAESGGTLALNAGGTGVTPIAGTGSGLLGGSEGLDLSPIAQTPAGSVTPLQAGPFDGSGGLLSQAGNYIANNPVRALGLAQTAYGLLGGGSHGAPSNGGSNGGGSKGGTGQGLTPGNGQSQQFYVNPYTLAQLQRSRGGQ
jgi:hypothetical protein